MNAKAKLMSLLKSMAALGIPGASGRLRAASELDRMQTSRHYPEWRSRRKTRGHRDHSLRIRSNRRKAAR